MICRIASIDDLQFFNCIKNKTWGSTKSIRKWKIGDYLLFIVDKKITALAKVSSDMYESDCVIWDTDLYPYRVSLEFKIIFSENNRIHIDETIKNMFINSWGKNYGTGIINKIPLLESDAQKIYTLLNLPSNDIDIFNNQFIELGISHLESIRGENKKLKKRLFNI